MRNCLNHDSYDFEISTIKNERLAIAAEWIVYKYSEITEKIIGCSMKVHRTFGNGFQEVLYQRALAIEMDSGSLSFEREKEQVILYKGVEIGTRRVDFLVEGKVLVEIKALTNLEEVHLAQAKNYLEAFNLKVGLLVNFGAKSLQFKRMQID